MKIKQEKALKEYNSLWREIDMLWHEIARKAGVSDSAHAILFAILELGEGCLQKDICGMCSISKQTIHSSIKNLEKAGLIVFGQENGRDKHLPESGYCPPRMQKTRYSRRCPNRKAASCSG